MGSAVFEGRFGIAVLPGLADDVVTRVEPGVVCAGLLVGDNAVTEVNALGGSKISYKISKLEHRTHAGSKDNNSFGGRMIGLNGGPRTLSVTVTKQSGEQKP